MSDAAGEKSKPQVEVNIGASYFKVVKAKKPAFVDEVTGKEVRLQVRKNNKRGRISTFTGEASRRLRNTMAQIKRDTLPCFVTLTYPKDFSFDGKQWKRDLDTFLKRLGRKFSNVSGIWKLEPQKRGAPHYHLIVWGVPCEELQDYVPLAWYKIAGGGDLDHLLWHLGVLHGVDEHCVERVRTPKAMYAYVCKYIAKSVAEKWGNVGKWWGIFFRDKLPFGEKVIFDVTDKKVLEIMRYFRRFGHIKSRDYPSLVLVCDVDQWLEKLSSVPVDGYREWLERLKKE